jgi:hypothetical protein
MKDHQRIASDREALLALAMAAVVDDGFCAHDALELLDALGRGDLIREARELNDESYDRNETEDDPEPEEFEES